MKGLLFVVLLCATGAFSGLVKPKLFPQHPAFAPKVHNFQKIVGGQEATPHSIPYQVGLFLDGYFCGGSLITSRHVLTAAHCGELTNRPEVVLGAHRIQDNEATQVILTGSKVTIHSGWDSSTLRNDISIIQLPQDVSLNDNIDTVAIAGGSSGNFAGQQGTASGWGLAHDGDTSISAVLRTVTSGILTNQQCQSQFGSGIPVYDTIICLDGSQGKSTCSGDSGGPLTVTSGSQKVQVGLTSYGVSIGCEKGYPAAFTRISSYADWIQSNAN